MSIWNSFFELFYPKLCICFQNRLIESENHICMDCRLKLSETKFIKKDNNKLEALFFGRFPFVHIASFAFFTKGGIIQKIIHEIKYRNNPSLAIYMGKLCGREILNQNTIQDIDFIVPVPLHKKRLKQRGYNQALLIAEGISEVIKVPINMNILIRKVNNPSQTRNSRFERWKNTEQVFDISDKLAFKNKHILLVDDVITTGSTVEACAKLIIRCNDSKISIFSIGAVI